MTAPLSASAARVQAALAGHGLPLTVVELPGSTRTAAEAARAIGCDVAQIVKSLVFRGQESEQPVLVLLSGADQVDEAALSRIVGEPVTRADPVFVRERTGYAIGGVPPLGHVMPLRTVIDSALLAFDELWAAAGTPHAVFRLTPASLRLIAGTAGVVTSVRKPAP